MMDCIECGQHEATNMGLCMSCYYGPIDEMDEDTKIAYGLEEE